VKVKIMESGVTCATFRTNPAVVLQQRGQWREEQR
jgi:hypothetical protein